MRGALFPTAPTLPTPGCAPPVPRAEPHSGRAARTPGFELVAAGARTGDGRSSPRAGPGGSALGGSREPARAPPALLRPWIPCPKTARVRRAGSPAGALPPPAGWWCRSGRRRAPCAQPSPTCRSPWLSSASSSTPSCQGWVRSSAAEGGSEPLRKVSRRERRFAHRPTAASRPGAEEGEGGRWGPQIAMWLPGPRRQEFGAGVLRNHADSVFLAGKSG